MAGNLVKSVMLKIVASDGDSEAKLDKISARADELARKHPDLKVKVDSAAASAKLGVLRMELRDTAKDADKTSFSIRKFGTSLASVASGGLSGGISEMSLMQKVMLGLNFATGLGEPLMAGLTVAVGGLSSGLVSAGAGVGVFGAVVKSTFSGLATNIKAATAAADKMASARTMKGFTADTKAFNAALKGLSKPQKELVTGAANAESGWHSFVKSAAGGVASVLVPALKMVPGILQLMQPFLAPVEGALRTIVGEVSNLSRSSGVKSFIGMLAGAAPGAIDALATAIGNVIHGIGGIIRAFMPVSGRVLAGVDKITAAFGHWGATLSQHSGFQALMSMFKTETPQAVGIVKNLAGVIKNVVSAMTGLSTFSNGRMLLQILGPLSGALKAISGNKAFVNFALYALAGFDAVKKLSNGITGVSNAFTAMKGAGSILQTVATKLGILRTTQVAATEATEGEAVAQGELDTAMDANPIGIIILVVAALAVAIVELWKHSTGFRNFWKGAWKDIEKSAVAAWHFIDNDLIHPLEHGISGVVNFVKSHWKTLATIIATVLLGPVAGIVVFVATHWTQIKNLTSRLVSDVGGFFRRLPGQILGFLSGLPGKMLSLGENIVKGLVHGVENMFGAVGSAIGHLASLIPSGLSKILSIFSPSKVTYWHGQMIGEGLAQGIESTLGRVTNASQRLAGAAIPGGGMSGAGGTAGGRPYLELRITGGDADTRTWLKKMIRVNGGNPEVFGH